MALHSNFLENSYAKWHFVLVKWHFVSVEWHFRNTKYRVVFAIVISHAEAQRR